MSGPRQRGPTAVPYPVGRRHIARMLRALPGGHPAGRLACVKGNTVQLIRIGWRWVGGRLGPVRCRARLTCHLTYLRLIDWGLERRRRSGLSRGRAGDGVAPEPWSVVLRGKSRACWAMERRAMRKAATKLTRSGSTCRRGRRLPTSGCGWRSGSTGGPRSPAAPGRETSSAAPCAVRAGGS